MTKMCWSFPRTITDLLRTYASWQNPKVVFCQNWLMVLRGLGDCRDYKEFGVRGLLCVGR